ncbi:LysR family transcriptional regulator [Streptomyces sp. NPDC047046]|uniref:LysR family transcriptional regulator n=1 Tax=Streptomyces sp. NPDC047046 TaxID=3155378 RepID=UPI0033FF7B57
MDIELRHARIVVTISEAGSISRGASELNLPQPSLTAQLKRIEKAVGGDLFVRSPSGVAPSPLGERLIPLFGDLVARADEVIAQANSATAGHVRLGNTEWTPPALAAALQGVLPGNVVATETLSPAAALAGVRRGVLSAAIVSGRARLAGPDPGVAEPALGSVVVLREPVWLALPALPERTEEVWVRYSREHWLHTVEERMFTGAGRAGPAQVPHHVSTQREAMIWVRDSGARALATPSGATADVRLRPLADTELVEMLLVWRRGGVTEETLRLLVEAVRDYYCAYARTVPGYWDWLVAHRAELPELQPWLPRSPGAREPGPEPVSKSSVNGQRVRPVSLT